MVKRGWMIVALALASTPLMSVVVPHGSTVSAQAVDEETERLFDDAMKAFRGGRDQEALSNLKKVLARDPSNEAAFQLREKVGFHIWVDLLTKRGETRAVINTFLDKARIGERTKRDDPDTIKKLLEKIRTGDYGEKRAAHLELERNHGDLAVPYILERFGESNDDEYKNDLTTLLTRMGPEATLPLIEALSTDVSATKTKACIALGLIRDDRAAGALKAIIETSQDVGLVAAADRALRGLNATGDVAGRPAKELLVELAAKYYRRSPGVMKEFSADRVVWKWTDDGLKKFEVPLYLYHLEVAEEACYDALAVDPNYRPAQVWLARVHLAEKQELESAAMANESAKELSEKMAKANFLASSAGVKNLEDAVRACIKDKDLAVAEAGIFTLRELLNNRTFQGGALSEALTSEHKVVRYASAIAIAELAPSPGFPGAENVVPLLSSCVAESTQRTVLVIDDSNETRNQLLSELRSLGYFAIGAHNGASGIMLAKRAPTPDLIVIKTTLGGEGASAISAQGVISEVKSDVRTKEIPILAMASEERAVADADLFGENVAGAIRIPLVKEAYAGTVKDAFGSRNVNQAKALTYATRAAGALAKLSGMSGSLDATGAFGNLLDSLADKPDQVKIPAMDALGGIGNVEALAPLKNLFENDGASSEARSAAAVAIGQIARSNGGELSADIFEALLKGLGSSDLTVARAAGRGLGIAPLSALQRSEMLTKNRISLSDVFGGGGE